MNTTFETNSRHLEQFLYAHDIRHSSWHKDIDGNTVWVYQDSDELRRVVDEFRTMIARRQQKASYPAKPSWTKPGARYPA